MADPIKILGIAGSLRKQSFNLAALRAAQQLCSADAKIEICTLEGIPGFNQDEEQNPPQKVIELKSRVRTADAILIATPEYNYGLPGVLKHAIDWASRPYGDSAWSGKPVAIMSAALSMGGACAPSTSCASPSCSSTWTPWCSPRWPSATRRSATTRRAT